MSENYIPLDDARNTIIEALNNFHPDLGRRAAEILYDDDPLNRDRRLNIVEISGREPKVMQCRAAGLTEQYLRERDMYHEDFAQQFSPFTEQENNRSFSVIDYEYDGTPTSVLYLAHELGHAIADDIQLEQNIDRNQFSWDEAEEQAYFIQNVYEHYSGNLSAESQSDANKGILRVSWERANQYQKATSRFEEALSVSQESRMDFIVKALCENHAESERITKHQCKGSAPVVELS